MYFSHFFYSDMFNGINYNFAQIPDILDTTRLSARV